MVVSVRGMERELEVSETLVRVTFTDGGVLVLMRSISTISIEKLLALPYVSNRHRSIVSAH